VYGWNAKIMHTIVAKEKFPKEAILAHFLSDLYIPFCNLLSRFTFVFCGFTSVIVISSSRSLVKVNTQKTALMKRINFDIAIQHTWESRRAWASFRG
jgi:hypothetical protein